MTYKEKCFSRLREIKLKILLNEIQMPAVNINIIKKKNFFMNQPYWEQVEKYKHLGILSGSLALKAYGLIKRDIYDIDFISSKVRLDEYLHTNKLKFQKHGMYSEEGFDNSIGFLEDKKYVVDFFEESGKELYEVHDDIKIQNPLEILELKIKLSDKRTKDSNDIDFIFSKLENSR